ncbi:hypothetical protein BpHYR1_044701 [Brachionus plicatilis]|uniref:Uncharacterized protein n=1 Tax=Brachionus plicatilis TaxID=10195 RepID=A0A3M7PL67_BRAPC|nr:hypothetical protein BpHYR1_044701 [Brachionus plicatilis]
MTENVVGPGNWGRFTQNHWTHKKMESKQWHQDNGCLKTYYQNGYVRNDYYLLKTGSACHPTS